MSESPKPTLGDSLNTIDRLIAWLDPDRGLNRLAKRQAFNSVSSIQSRAHESSSAGRLRKFYKDGLGPNGIVSQGAVAIRAQARHMDRNNDIARGIIRTMVNNVVGPNGIAIEPLAGHEVHAAVGGRIQRIEHETKLPMPKVGNEIYLHFGAMDRPHRMAALRLVEGA